MPKRIEKRGENSYRLCVTAGYTGDGKQKFYRKTITATTEREAKKQYALFVAEVEKGQTASCGKMTLNQFFSYWKEHYAENHLAKKTILDYTGLFQRISFALGHKRLDHIQPKDLLAFFKNISEVGIRQDPNKSRRKKSHPEEAELISSKPLSPSTQRKYYALLHSLFEKATLWNMIPYNPASKIEPPKLDYIPKEIYDKETTGKFLLELEGESLKHRVMALLALSIGARKGELFGLSWNHINLETGTVKIERQLQYFKEDGLVLNPLKTRSSKRTNTIPKSLLPLLKTYKVEQTSQRLKLGEKWEGAPSLDEDFIFTAWNGQPNHPDTFNSWLKRFTSTHALPSLTPHSFRHMAATYLLTAGTDIKTVSGKLGHSSTAITGTIYSHMLETSEQASADKMEDFLQQTTSQAKRQKKQAN
ncbi:tyrosine-type recombinase/integrase [Anaeroarcus burkinensis]|uniref:tyrosine-type recombinase/integrase n=1 Tax=Anaeroarcus burkinensis TaxID=82376 RepID=UPI00041D40F8|nr:site-specific integrase [Anaeroarcus burkinensis]